MPKAHLTTKMLFQALIAERVRECLFSRRWTTRETYSQQSFTSEHMRKWVDYDEYIRSICMDIDYAAVIEYLFYAGNTMGNPVNRTFTGCFLYYVLVCPPWGVREMGGFLMTLQRYRTPLQLNIIKQNGKLDSGKAGTKAA